MFFDWITPLLSFASSSKRDRFAVAAGNWDKAKQMLKEQGIRTHWPNETAGFVVFDVDPGTGSIAQAILEWNGLL